MSALADVAAAIADRTRARMLEELLAGPPLPAGALAVRVGVAPSTVSGHLARLEAAGLVTVTSVGRRREASLAGPHVAEASRRCDASPATIRARSACAPSTAARRCARPARATTTSPVARASRSRTDWSPAAR